MEPLSKLLQHTLLSVTWTVFILTSLLPPSAEQVMIATKQEIERDRHARSCHLQKGKLVFQDGDCTARTRFWSCSGFCASNSMYHYNSHTKLFDAVQSCSCCHPTQYESKPRKRVLHFNCPGNVTREPEEIWLPKPLACGCVHCSSLLQKP